MFWLIKAISLIIYLPDIVCLVTVQCVHAHIGNLKAVVVHGNIPALIFGGIFIYSPSDQLCSTAKTCALYLHIVSLYTVCHGIMI